MKQIPDGFDKYGLALDCAAHWLHCYSLNEIASDRYTLKDMLCKRCGTPVVYRYHESTLYTVCCKRCQYSAQVCASNPEEAASYFATKDGTGGSENG